ncbi:MAG: YraN family protein [Clostridiales bacterium]|nr:YraN family protein [Clostridiales bacterium]
MNKRRIGSNYEKLACEFLEGKGYTIIEKNFRCHQGEIDIIGKADEYICFIEVKYRKNKISGYSAEAVTPSKQKTIIKVAKYYLNVHGLSLWSPMRFDVVTIDDKDIELLINAFGGM